ncbi:urease accessory protein UreD [Streptomyces sp. NPDC088251]|uniref:urease accessory protein UreD n=1 Tax=unclassified Streptomyces TaxID=2593676 RepID=UPI00380D3917
MTRRTVAPAEPGDPTVVSVVRDAAGRHVARELRPGAFLAPRPLLPSPDRVRIALVGTRAGLLAGDDLLLHIAVGPGARLELVEPSGLVAYDHRGGTSRWRARVDIAEGGELRWDARPFVIATGARVERSMDVALASGARMLWRDTLVLGRSGERGGSLRATTRATYDGRELLVEDLDLTDPELRELPGILGPNRVIGSVTSLGAKPGGAPHRYRMELAGPGTQVRLLDTVAPTVEAELSAVWADWLSA